jgi:site-specific DNA-methyltransferase (adenine-specific)
MSISLDLVLGDCLEIMDEIQDGVVDLVLTDPPYGTTRCKWDEVIPFEPMWESLWRVSKERTPIVLFSKEPFTATLVTSQIRRFKQRLIWKKDNHDNPLQAKQRFLNITEDISVFYKRPGTYNPQGIVPYGKTTRQGRGKSLSQRDSRAEEYTQAYTNYPRNILDFARDSPRVHPTQKPVALLEYLIKTYTNEGDLVLDFTMGSGSTGVACKNTGRNFIGIERDEKYFNIARERVLG